ncbi:MAG TPA: phosphoribosylpyrophosphate synthetase [Chitinophagales bacterium]|nr:phosphoribosylpyrophosphate synthetase [Chitinophagales bacterium]
MKNFDTVTEAVSDLQRRGYTHNLTLEKQSLLRDEKEIFLHPQDFEVDEVYRFEGNSDPGDENVVYAISSAKHNFKGILMSAFGTYSDLDSPELLAKLQYNR